MPGAHPGARAARGAYPGFMHEHVVGTVSPRLAPFVASVHGYRLEGFPAGTHVGLPSRSLTVVISLSDPLVVSGPGESAPATLGSLVAGLHDRPALIHHDGNQHGIQLALTPRGARALFGVPPRELACRVVDLEDLLARRCRAE